ncbi:hypothetical protein DM02DRAFT_661285 [Periconia macrospinosa]|uniref:Uncharacterized protein n=1 Tax=Periconia macrospinosa TaxID=97972 RepID=A0A2V1D7S4_9PLEO|nr:hypothetical protein DM02DRAFT_661285 [Periconia macrospinosa]
MSFALVPWIAAHGYLLVGVELTVLQAVCGLIVVPIAFWGKSMGIDRVDAEGYSAVASPKHPGSLLSKNYVSHRRLRV